MKVKAGSRITCPNDHVIAFIPVDLVVGEDGGWGQRLVWHQPMPPEGDPAVCMICGFLWCFRQIGNRGWLHVDDDWTPALTSAAEQYLASQNEIGFGTPVPV